MFLLHQEDTRTLQGKQEHSRPEMSTSVTKPTNQDVGHAKSANQKRNAYTPVRIDPDSDYVTPGAFELEQLFWATGGAEYTHVNEVWPRLFIGDE